VGLQFPLETLEEVCGVLVRRVVVEQLVNQTLELPIVSPVRAMRLRQRQVVHVGAEIDAALLAATPFVVAATLDDLRLLNKTTGQSAFSLGSGRQWLVRAVAKGKSALPLVAWPAGMGGTVPPSVRPPWPGIEFAEPGKTGLDVLGDLAKLPSSHSLHAGCL